MLASAYRGAPSSGLRSHPQNLIRIMPAKGARWSEVGTRKSAPRAEPGFARREPNLCSNVRGAKEGAHGGTMGSPVLTDPDHAGEGSSWQFRVVSRLQGPTLAVAPESRLTSRPSRPPAATDQRRSSRSRPRTPSE